MNTHCIIVESLDTGVIQAERVESDGPSHMDLAEEIVTTMGLMPGERWRWGLMQVSDPGWARFTAASGDAKISWHEETFTQGVTDEDPDT